MTTKKELEARVKELEAKLKAYDDAVERSLNPIFKPAPEGYWKCWRCMRLVKDGWRCCDD